MQRIIRKIKTILSMIQQGEIGFVVSEVKRWINSESRYYTLGRPADMECNPAEPAIPVTIRLIKEKDIPIVFNYDDPDLQTDEVNFLKMVEAFHYADIGERYVVVTSEDTPCCIICVGYHSDNEKILQHYKGSYPQLEPTVAFYFHTFMLKAYRGKKISTYAWCTLADTLATKGITQILTHVGVTNVASIKGCKRAGFAILETNIEKWQWFRRSERVEPYVEPQTS